jgi:signal-transduction protein with cAMP-binding, CBS, and nucleotidyltransferase domain
MTGALDAIGFPFCTGEVMATNPVWRKSLSGCRRPAPSRK